MLILIGSCLLEAFLFKGLRTWHLHIVLLLFLVNDLRKFAMRLQIHGALCILMLHFRMVLARLALWIAFVHIDELNVRLTKLILMQGKVLVHVGWLSVEDRAGPPD